MTEQPRGRRAGARKAARRPRELRPQVAALVIGALLAFVAWGYLVYAAISFGADARGGDHRDWGFLALATVGAVACLFVGLMLLTRLIRGRGPATGARRTTQGRRSRRD